MIVTINREVGSGGRTIGELLAKRLGIPFYDKAVAEGLQEKFGLSKEAIERIKVKRDNWMNQATKLLHKDGTDKRIEGSYVVPTPQNVFQAEAEILRSLGEKGSCVVAGRLAHHAFAPAPDVVRVFICEDKELRVQRMMKKSGKSLKEAQKTLTMLDESREAYTQRFTGMSRYDTHNYDVVLNVDYLTDEQAADILATIVNQRL